MPSTGSIVPMKARVAKHMMCRRTTFAAVLLMLIGDLTGAQQVAAQGSETYRCPGPAGRPDEYTNLISAQEAKSKGCRTIEGTPITIIQSNKPRASSPVVAPMGSERVDASAQRSRDTERRSILDAELRKEEQALAALQKEYNGGEPERRGDERNYQKYLDRTSDLKASLARKESDIAALRREIGKLAAQ